MRDPPSARARRARRRRALAKARDGAEPGRPGGLVHAYERFFAGRTRRTGSPFVTSLQASSFVFVSRDDENSSRARSSVPPSRQLRAALREASAA